MQQIGVQSTWPGSAVQVSLISASGHVFDRTTQGAGVIHQLQPNAETLVIANPEPGQWTVQLYGANVSSAGESVRVDTTLISQSAFGPVAYVSASTDRGVAPVTIQLRPSGSSSIWGAPLACSQAAFGCAPA